MLVLYEFSSWLRSSGEGYFTRIKRQWQSEKPRALAPALRERRTWHSSCCTRTEPLSREPPSGNQSLVVPVRLYIAVPLRAHTTLERTHLDTKAHFHGLFQHGHRFHFSISVVIRLHPLSLHHSTSLVPCQVMAWPFGSGESSTKLPVTVLASTSRQVTT